MGFLDWFGQNWYVFLQSAGIIGRLLFTAFALRTDAKARQVGNLLTVTQQHRDIWRQVSIRPELARILESEVDLAKVPVLREEEMLILQLILPLSSVYRAMQDGMYFKLSGLRMDVRSFFSLPIPKSVWHK